MIPLPSRFLRESKKPKNIPFALVTIFSRGTSDISTSEADWGDNLDESNVDYSSSSPPPEAGQVILEANPASSVQSDGPPVYPISTTLNGWGSGGEYWHTKVDDESDSDFARSAYYSGVYFGDGWVRGGISLSDLINPISEDVEIFSVKLVYRARYDSSRMRDVQSKLKYNGSWYSGTNIGDDGSSALTSSFAEYEEEWTGPPDAPSVTWTRDLLANIQEVGFYTDENRTGVYSTDLSSLKLIVVTSSHLTEGYITTEYDLSGGENEDDLMIVNISQQTPVGSSIIHELLTDPPPPPRSITTSEVANDLTNKVIMGAGGALDCASGHKFVSYVDTGGDLLVKRGWAGAWSTVLTITNPGDNNRKQHWLAKNEAVPGLIVITWIDSTGDYNIDFSEDYGNTWNGTEDSGFDAVGTGGPCGLVVRPNKDIYIFTVNDADSTTDVYALKRTWAGSWSAPDNIGEAGLADLYRTNVYAREDGTKAYIVGSKTSSKDIARYFEYTFSTDTFGSANDAYTFDDDSAGSPWYATNVFMKELADGTLVIAAVGDGTDGFLRDIKVINDTNSSGWGNEDILQTATDYHWAAGLQEDTNGRIYIHANNYLTNEAKWWYSDDSGDTWSAEQAHEIDGFSFTTHGCYCPADLDNAYPWAMFIDTGQNDADFSRAGWTDADVPPASIIKDGDVVDVGLSRTFVVVSTLISATGSVTPILNSIELEIPDKIYRFSDRRLPASFSNHVPALLDIPGRTIEIDLLKYVTKTSKLVVELAVKSEIQDMLRDNYMKNLEARIDYGFYFSGVSPEDTIPYYRGKIEDFASSYEMVKLALTDAGRGLDAKWPAPTPPATAPSEEFNEEHMVDIIQTIMADIPIAPRFIDDASFITAKGACGSDPSIPITSADWIANRTIADGNEITETKKAGEYIGQLLQLLGAYLVVPENGRIKMVIYSPDVVDADDPWTIRDFGDDIIYRAGLLKLKNAFDLYLDWDGEGSEGKDYSSLFVTEDSGSKTNYEETNRVVLKSDWIYGAASAGLYGEEMAEYITGRETTRLADGLGEIKCDTSMAKAGIQVGDFVTIQSPIILNPLIGRAAETKAMVVKKTWNIKANKLTWILMEAR